jgi:SAM-dependent methyltransferase/ketosteroid isomerase-like protein
MQTMLEHEVRAFIDRWNQAMIAKDAAAAADLREDGYSAVWEDGRLVTKLQEVEMIAATSHRLDAVTIESLTVQGRGNRATASFESVIEGEYLGEPIKLRSRDTLSLRRSGGQWRARSFRKVDAEANTQLSAKHRTLASRVCSRLKRSLHRARHALFQESAFVPYRPGADFVIPKQLERGANDGELPTPPPELWLGYAYPKHGRTHVDKMLELVHASGLQLQHGARVLDFGCGAGRMIRHLQHLADTCVIWGTDISAEHIYWCKEHLSPPFHFATTTKVPHLPFEDRSFALIYCGSVFTHIDDLADAWLLELHRILAPDGRLYVTLHDNHTIELFDSGKYDSADIVVRIKSHRTYQRAKNDFGMFTIGRDARSQVFYHIDYFQKMLQPMFEVASITTEAYFYQTALVLKRRP